MGDVAPSDPHRHRRDRWKRTTARRNGVRGHPRNGMRSRSGFHNLLGSPHPRAIRPPSARAREPSRSTVSDAAPTPSCRPQRHQPPHDREGRGVDRAGDRTRRPRARVCRVADAVHAHDELRQPHAGHFAELDHVLPVRHRYLASRRRDRAETTPPVAPGRWRRPARRRRGTTSRSRWCRSSTPATTSSSRSR